MLLFCLVTNHLAYFLLMWYNCSSPVGKVTITLCGRKWQQGGVGAFVGKEGRRECKGLRKYTTA